jgi:hypothetical protein
MRRGSDAGATGAAPPQSRGRGAGDQNVAVAQKVGYLLLDGPIVVKELASLHLVSCQEGLVGWMFARAEPKVVIVHDSVKRFRNQRHRLEQIRR